MILFEEGWAAWRSARGYVENVAAALALATVSERAAGRVYNVAEQPAYSEIDWARKIAAATARDFKRIAGDERAAGAAAGATTGTMSYQFKREPMTGG